MIYAIVLENYPDLQKESTTIPTRDSKEKYAMIIKKPFEDKEVIQEIVFSDNLDTLSSAAKEYDSYYIYPNKTGRDFKGNNIQLWNN
jgi:hypothetical protein